MRTRMRITWAKGTFVPLFVNEEDVFPPILMLLECAVQWRSRNHTATGVFIVQNPIEGAHIHVYLFTICSRLKPRILHDVVHVVNQLQYSFSLAADDPSI